ncbi:MAG: hypothetical protein ABMA26_05665 [Limisphaerales bacterium]
MKIALTVQGGADQIEVDAQPFSIRSADGSFCVTTPMHDDWLQSVNFDLRQAMAEIVSQTPIWVICFPDAKARSQFQAWLTEANAKARHGYSTMYP